jgi:hypothetical protein
MEMPFNLAPRPSWCSGEKKRPKSLVRLGARSFALTVELDAGERQTLPLGRVTFQLRSA